MFEWLKKICKFDKAKDSIFDEKIFEEGESFCKAKVNGNILAMRDTECSLLLELKKSQKFINALNEERDSIVNETYNMNKIPNIVKLFNNVNKGTGKSHFCKIKKNEMTELIKSVLSITFCFVDIPELIKELEFMDSSTKIIKEYDANILATWETIYKLKEKLGIEDV